MIMSSGSHSSQKSQWDCILSYTNRLLQSLVLLISIFYISGIEKLEAQAPPVIHNPFPCPNPDIIPKGCLNKTYTITFELEGATGVSASWAISSAAGFTRPPWLSIINRTATTCTLSGNPTGAGTNFGFNLSVTDQSDNSTITSAVPFKLTIDGTNCGSWVGPCPCLQEIVYVLDRSGSMAQRIIPGDISTPVRLDKLKEVVAAQRLTLTTMAATSNLDANDKWTVVTFDSEGIKQSSGNFGSTPSDNDLLSQVITPAGWTGMGGGLQLALKHAFEGLGHPGQGKNRIIVLVTDGEQNRNPMVTGIPGTMEIKCVPSEVPANGIDLFDYTTAGHPSYPNLGSEILDLSNGKYKSVKIYSIDVGFSTTAIDAPLENLSRNSDADFADGRAPADLSALHTHIIQKWLSGCSPRVVDFRTGKIATGSQSIEKFYANDSIQAITLQFFATDHAFTSAYVEVYKDGTYIKGVTTAEQPHLQLAHIDLTDSLTLALNPVLAKPAGLWEVRLYDLKPVSYTFSAFAEDKKIHHELHLGNGENFYAGDPIQVKATITYDGQGISGDTAWAYLYRPGDDLGDLAANAPRPDSLASPDRSPAQVKIDDLMAKQAYFDSLKAEERIIALTDNGNGEYTGVFKGNNVSGPYKVIVRFEGTHPFAKHYQGWELEGAFFDFARPNDINLNQTTTPGAVDGGFQNYTVTITPTNQLNRKIGPGQANRIRATLPPPGSVYDIEDNLDGSYTIKLKAPESANPDVTVFVIDQVHPVEKFPLVPNSTSWSLSLHAGATLPGTGLNATFDPGPFVEADLTYRFSPKWDAELLLGYYGFKSSFSILGASLSAGYSITLSPPSLRLRFAGGLGVYKPENLDVTWGYTGRAELVRSINPNLDVSLHTAYFGLPDPNLAFSTIGLGVKYQF